jgi:hypothetical protein
VRRWLVALALIGAGCTINLVKKSGEPERLKQQVELFKWLYERGVYRADPELMRRAAARLLDAGRERETQASHEELLERLLPRLDAAIDRLLKEPAPIPPSPR